MTDDGALVGLRGRFTKAEWALLPLKLKDRWWDETDYGKNDPSEELRAAIREALRK